MTESTDKKTEVLYRYTYIPDLLYILGNKKLFLSNPENWKDKTDSAFLKEYAKGEEVRAICFFEDGERNHYWEIYAEYGCLIAFDKEKLLDGLPKKSRKGIFDKREVEHIDRKKFDLKEHGKILPFIKQVRYKNEREFRIVWKGKKGKKERNVFIPIDLKSIKRITVSGDIKERYARYLIKVIREMYGKELGDVEITRSELYESKMLVNKLTPKGTPK
jgi:hypothetical protein